MLLCKKTVRCLYTHECVVAFLQTNVYKHVVDDVIRGVREEFLNEAVDLEVLEDLKRVSIDLVLVWCMYSLS